MPERIGEDVALSAESFSGFWDGGSKDPSWPRAEIVEDSFANDTTCFHSVHFRSHKLLAKEAYISVVNRVALHASVAPFVDESKDLDSVPTNRVDFSFSPLPREDDVQVIISVPVEDFACVINVSLVNVLLVLLSFIKVDSMVAFSSIENWMAIISDFNVRPWLLDGLFMLSCFGSDWHSLVEADLDAFDVSNMRLDTMLALLVLSIVAKEEEVGNADFTHFWVVDAQDRIRVASWKWEGVCWCWSTPAVDVLTMEVRQDLSFTQWVFRNCSEEIFIVFWP